MADVFHRVALVNPPWRFEGSRFWACEEAHLPLELLYSEALLRQRGLDTLIVDAHLEGLSIDDVAARVGGFRPDLVVVTTAPSYLFWRCPPPELGIPIEASRALGSIAPVVAVGPHGSATPGYALDAIGCWAVVRGEPEEELVRISEGSPSSATVLASRRGENARSTVASVDLNAIPALDYEGYPLERKTHRHHLFSGSGLGAEVEFSRGCPYRCSFCNRRYFRSSYRERPLERLLLEMDRLSSRGIAYVYFIDELFGLGGTDELLDALTRSGRMGFGCQTRIELWDEARLDRLAAAGAVSVEFGLESPFPEVRELLRKGCPIDSNRALALLAYAKTRIPWVQADLVAPHGMDDGLRERTEAWRQIAISRGVWVSEPVPIFPYPGSDLHDELLGPVSDSSWIRAREGGPCGS